MKKSLLKRSENDLLRLPAYQRVALIVMLSLFILWSGWEFWLSDIYRSMHRLEKENLKLEEKIKKIELENYRKVLKKIEHERLAVLENIKKRKYELQYIKGRAREHNFMWFDEERFLVLFEKIMAYSIRLGIRIDRVETLPVSGEKKDSYISIKKRVSMSGAGNFADIMKLVYYIESFKILLSTEYLKIVLFKKEEEEGGGSELRFRIIIVQYGVSL
jgi:Tfp pilus assembly protein PilO